MTYASQQDLIDRFGDTELVQLSDRAGTGGVNAAVVAKVLTDTDAEIDAYLGGRYTLPLNPVPTVLPRVAADIARYRLWADRASDEVRARYTDAIKFLTAVSKGDVLLGANTPAAAGSPSGSPIYDAPERVFSRDTLGDY